MSYWAGPSWSCSIAVYKPVWHIPLLSVQWINSWWGTDELSETCRVSWQNKFVKLVHLVGFIVKKIITHGHMNVEYYLICNLNLSAHCSDVLQMHKASRLMWVKETADSRQPREQRSYRSGVCQNGVCWRTFISVLHCSYSRGKLQQMKHTPHTIVSWIPFHLMLLQTYHMLFDVCECRGLYGLISESVAKYSLRFHEWLCFCLVSGRLHRKICALYQLVANNPTPVWNLLGMGPSKVTKIAPCAVQ